MNNANIVLPQQIWDINMFITPESLKHIKMAERCYIPNNEKEYYKNVRSSDAKLGEDKVKLARIQYRGKGHYIDEILN